jgi:hypothetical protein
MFSCGTKCLEIIKLKFAQALLMKIMAAMRTVDSPDTNIYDYSLFWFGKI